MAHQAQPDRLLPSREVRDRFGVSDMTLHRWRKAGVLPDPVVIRGRNYWPEATISALQRGGAA